MKVGVNRERSRLGANLFLRSISSLSLSLSLAHSRSAPFPPNANLYPAASPAPSFTFSLSHARETRTPFPTRCWMSYLAHTERSMSSTEGFAGTAPLIFFSFSFFSFDFVAASLSLEEIESSLLPPRLYRPRLAFYCPFESRNGHLGPAKEEREQKAGARAEKGGRAREPERYC